MAFVTLLEIHANAWSELQGGIAEEFGPPFSRTEKPVVEFYSQPKWGCTEEKWTLRHFPRNFG